jgi:hypothetical protein
VLVSNDRPQRSTTAYEIRDVAGELAAIHERHDDPDGSKRFTWRRPDGAAGLNGTSIASLPLYRVDKLGAGPYVVVCEGEKSADALAAVGIPAVATVTGAASTPGRAALAELTGRAVVVWPDADDVGHEHMRRVIAGLEKVGAASVRMIDWPDAPAHGDAADFLASGGTSADVEALILTAHELPIMASRAEPERALTALGHAERPATIGTRTAEDLAHGAPPDQLGEPYLTAEGTTCLYGRGGVGKGIMSCWLTMRLVRDGHVVLILDFEGHEREFGSRLRGLGMTDDELRHVHYRAPFGSDWTAPTGPLSKVAPAVRDDCERLGVTYLVIDSYSVATSNGDTMGGEAAAREFFTALAMIGLPNLVIAHVKGDSGKFPERPFGSVFVHNLARETWAVERVGGDEPDDDPDLIRFGPHVVSLELRNRKSNGRPKAPAQFVTFEFYADGSIEVATDQPAGRSVAELAADVLADGPLTLPKIAAAIMEDTGQTIAVDSLRVTLKRHPKRFEQATSGRPRTWSVRP